MIMPCRDSHVSGNTVTDILKRPTRESWRGRPPHPPLFGLAPGGVYPAIFVAEDAVSSYLTISPLLRPVAAAVYFLWHFPWDRSPWPLASTLPCRARTFLETFPVGREWTRDCLSDFSRVMIERNGGDVTEKTVGRTRRRLPEGGYSASSYSASRALLARASAWALRFRLTCRT